MFYELLNNPSGSEPGHLQADARQRFPFIVRKSHLKERIPGPIPGAGKYVILGIASYSRDELKLLDEVEASHSNWEQDFKIVVFDVMDCKDMVDITEYAPPFSAVTQTPIISLWEGGRPVNSKTGLRMTRETLQGAGVLR
jgi:hypothetical protein